MPKQVKHSTAESEDAVISDEIIRALAEPKQVKTTFRGKQLIEWILAMADWAKIKPVRADCYMFTKQTNLHLQQFKGKDTFWYWAQLVWLVLYGESGEFIQVPRSKILNLLAQHSAETGDDFKYLEIEWKKDKRVLDKKVPVNRFSIWFNEESWTPEGQAPIKYFKQVISPIDEGSPMTESLVDKYQKLIGTPAGAVPEPTDEV
jgi:hypothetical protein